MKTPNFIKALSLISGGLDSLLATKLILEQGIYVEGINFFSGFFGEWPKTICNPFAQIDQNRARESQKFTPAWIADQLGIKLNVVDVIEEYKSVLAQPKYGYGSCLNPCLDCKIFMVNYSKRYIQEHNFDFIITGEVIGQRPMSQRKDTLPIVAKNLDDRLLRPLCAKLLEPTLPEREGWVNRDLLCDFSGRSRKPQIELAKKFGFTEYPQPAGGCLLADEGYSARLRDLWQQRNTKDYSFDDIVLLRIGRHLRPTPLINSCKLIIGRDAAENDALAKFKNKMTYLHAKDFPGSLVLLEFNDNSNTFLTEQDLQLLAQITARFSQGKNAENVEVMLGNYNSADKILKVNPLAATEIPQEWYI